MSVLKNKTHSVPLVKITEEPELTKQDSLDPPLEDDYYNQDVNKGATMPVMGYLNNEFDEEDEEEENLVQTVRKISSFFRFRNNEPICPGAAEDLLLLLGF